MRIMILISSLRGGGAERTAVTLSRLWADAGHGVRLTTIDSVNSDFYKLDPRVARAELDLERPSKTLLQAVANNIRRIAATRREIRTFDPDVVVALMPTANALAGMASIGLRCKVIGSERMHPPQMPMDRMREAARTWLYGLLDAMTALTNETADWLRANTRIKNVRVIPNVVTWPLEATTPAIAPDSVCKAGRSILLAAGRLEPEKGFDDLIDAFAAIALSETAWDLVIVGEGLQRAALQGKIDALGLANRITMPGRVGNIGDWYAHASLYVMSSRHEGFPNTLAEAMAHGLAAVSYDCDTGPRDIVRSGIDGALVPPGDTDALSRALSTLMKDDATRARYAARAPDVRTRFSEVIVMQKWDDLLNEITRR